MAITHVGSTSEHSMDDYEALPMPEGAQPGDLAIVVLTSRKSSGGDFSMKNWTARADGFSLVTVKTRNPQPGLGGGDYNGWRRWTMYRILTDEDMGRDVEWYATSNQGYVQSPGRAQLVVLRGPGGVGATRHRNITTGAGQNTGVLVVWGYRAAQYVIEPNPYGYTWEQAPGGDIRWRDTHPDGEEITFDYRFDPYAVSVELLGVLPGVPAPASPTGGVHVPADGPVEVSWSSTDATQHSYRARFSTDGGGTWFNWDADAAELVEDEPGTSSDRENEGRDRSLQLPVGTFPAGVTVTWQVRVRAVVGGPESDWSQPETFYVAERPTVVVSAPSGTVTENLAPVVAWSPTTPEGEQTAYQVAVPGVYDTGAVRSGAVEHAEYSEVWVNGGEYVARVRVQQTGGLWSDWVESPSFTMSWEPPAAPEVVAVPSRDGGVVLSVSHPLAGVVSVDRDEGDGVWRPVVHRAPLLTDGVAELRDVLAPFGRPVDYRVRVWEVRNGDQLFASAWEPAGPVLSQDDRTYLVADGDRTDFVRVFVTQDVRGETGAAAFVSEPLGSSRRVVRYGTDRGRTGTLTLITYGEADRATVAEWLGRNEPLVLRFPPEGSDRSVPGEVIRFARSSRWTAARRAQTTSIGWRDFTFDWVEVL